MDVIVPFSMSCAVGALGDDLWMSVLPLWLLKLNVVFIWMPSNVMDRFYIKWGRKHIGCIGIWYD